MAVFTAIASAIVAGLGFAASFSAAFGAATALSAGTITALGVGTKLLAAGLMVATAKATGLFKPPSIQQAKDPGVKIQLQPSTDNRIPVFYGRVNTGGIAVDAGITNQNNTMIYVFVIGEKTDSGTYSVNKIKRGDATLNFSGASVTSITDPNATSTNNVNGKMRCRVYAGNAQSSANQIFPTTGTPVAAQTLLSTISATTNYEDLVYAVFEMDYDPENGLTQLGQITFDITNSLSEPSNVLLDYCQNSRYGAGLANTDLDLNSFNDMYDYATANVEYLTSANVSAYHDRWQIDGMLSTYQDVKTNIDMLCQNSATYFTYDNKQGKFKVVPNRAATTAEKANAFIFSDDNILSKISITSTELYSLYNRIEAEYPSIEKDDQTDIVIVDTPSGDRNPNEPDNPLQARYELNNTNSRVHNLANIDLRQSRISTVLDFEASYEALQVDVGDVVKVTNSLYGYNEKLFRCMRVSEVETAEGMLKSKVILLEYDDSVYEHNVVQSYAAPGLSGIPGWWTGIWGNANITIPGNILITNPVLGNANIVDPATGNILGGTDYANIDWANIRLGGVGQVDTTVPIVNIPIVTPNIPGVENLCIDLGYDNAVSGTKANTCWTIPAPGANATFAPNTSINVAVPVPANPTTSTTLPGGPTTDSYNLNIDVTGIGGGGSWFTNTNSIANIPVNNPGMITPERVQDIGIGLQVDEAPADVAGLEANSDPSFDLGNANSIFTPAVTVPLGGIDYGEYTSLNSIVPFGALDPNIGAYVAFQVSNRINYEEFYEANSQPTGNVIPDYANGGGAINTFTNAIPPTVSDNFSFTMSPAQGAVAANTYYGGTPPAGMKYYPANVVIQPYANNSLSNVSGTVFQGFRYKGDVVRNTKADQYRDLR